jgi:predicted nucleotidyltransferase
VEDTGDYPLITGKLTQGEEFSQKTAIDILNDMGENFTGDRDFIAFDIRDKGRTSELIQKSRDKDKLPIALTITEHSEDGNKENVYRCCDDLNASLYGEVKVEQAEVQGVRATFELKNEKPERTGKDTRDKAAENKGTVKSGEDVVALFRAKTDEMFHEIDGANAESIEAMVRNHVEASIDFFELDAKVVDVVLVGSRCRGIEREDSDVDVVVEFYGSEREDALFDMLNEDGLMVGDKRIDINPITEGKTGTLQEYLPEVEAYLTEKAQTMEQEVMATDKAVYEEEERAKKKAQRPSREAEGKFANFEFVKCEKDKRYFMYADIQFPSGEIERHKPIAEFPDKKDAVAFCKKNNIVFEDSTNNIDNVIRHKKKLSNEKGQDKSEPPQANRSRGNGMEDD